MLDCYEKSITGKLLCHKIKGKTFRIGTISSSEILAIKQIFIQTLPINTLQSLLQQLMTLSIEKPI